jgi:methylenetetrahydrofolate dehydrogenase (NADP+)/methenyltetrahydrofolate cyclohydrolase
VIATLSPPKDVDGFHVAKRRRTDASGSRASGLHAYGCMNADRDHRRALRGKHAVVIGRSNTVGKPMALMLLQANATVTVCHSATADLARTRAAPTSSWRPSARRTRCAPTWSSRARS